MRSGQFNSYQKLPPLEQNAEFYNSSNNNFQIPSGTGMIAELDNQYFVKSK